MKELIIIGLTLIILFILIILLMILQIMSRELKGHGTCDSLWDYLTCCMVSLINGMTLIILGMNRML